MSNSRQMAWFVGRSMLALGVVILPLLVILLGIVQQFGVSSSASTDWLGEGILLYVGLFPTVIVAGLVYSLLLFLCVKRWPSQLVMLAIVLVLAMICSLAVSPFKPLVQMPRTLVAIGLAFACYAALSVHLLRPDRPHD